MLTFQQRRDTILSQFAQAKADLETLNSDIDAEIFASRVEYAAYAPRR